MCFSQAQVAKAVKEGLAHAPFALNAHLRVQKEGLLEIQAIVRVPPVGMEDQIYR
jgi:hypothetical protein